MKKLALLLAVFTFATTLCYCQQNGFLSVTGQKQGVIKGGVNEKGHEGQMWLYRYHSEVVSPRDPQSGLPTGRRVHKPITITKPIDRSTPLFAQALVTNENLSEVILHIYDNNREVYQIKLINANISDISQEMSLNQTSTGARLPVLENISFTFQKIEWRWLDGGTSASDNWESRP